MNLRGARGIYPSLVQMNKVKTKGSEGFSGRYQKSPQKNKKVLTKILSNFPAEIRNSNGFSGPKQVISKKKKKKRCLSQQCHVNYENMKISICTPIAPSLLITSGNSPRLGGGTVFVWGHKKSFAGARPRYVPRGAGSDYVSANIVYKTIT